MQGVTDMPTNRTYSKEKCSKCSAPTKSAAIAVSEKNRLRVKAAAAEIEKCSPFSDTEAYVCTECGHIDFYAADVNVFKEMNR
jgi:hypothetical protein